MRQISFEQQQFSKFRSPINPSSFVRLPRSKMNPKILFSAALVCMSAHIAQGTVAIAATLGTAALTLTAAQTTALVGGLVLLKKAALLAGAVGGRRGRRDTRDDVAEFSVISQTEPEQCYKRLICDLASGQMGKSENEVILSLFHEDSPISSPKFDYMIASKLGKQAKSIETCEIRFGCKLSGQQIEKLLA